MADDPNVPSPWRWRGKDWFPATGPKDLKNEIDDLFNRFFGEGDKPPMMGGPFSPAMDVDETDTDLVVKAEIPGMDATQIDVSISSGTLTIKGEKKEEREEKEEGRHSIERSFGSFSRSFRLPFPVDEDNIKASYKHGVLTVTLPKIEPAVKKSIQVES